MMLTLQFAKQFSTYAGTFIVAGATLFALLQFALTRPTSGK